MILITDDTPENIYSLKRLLELNQFEVDSAQSGEEALKKVLKNDYSLLILDVQMPGMDGFEVAEALKGLNKSRDLPIIFLSAVNKGKEFVTKGYTSGAVDYLTKPVDADVFILKVRTLHALYEQKREINKAHSLLKREVDERKKAEIELKKTVAEMQLFLESLPQLAFSANTDGDIEFVNQQWLLFSKGTKAFPRFHPEDGDVLSDIRASFTSGHSMNKEVRIRNLVTGEDRYHQFNLIPVSQGGKVLRWVGTFSDIHEQKMMREVLENKVKERTAELEFKNQQLESRNDELEQFVFVSSHDLKEPLRKIQIFSSYLNEKISRIGDEKSELYLKKINQSAGRMAGLIEDLLKYSRISEEEAAEEIDLRKLWLEIIDDLEMLITEKNATIKIGPLLCIRGLAGQIRQVFQNLLANALKFSQKDSAPQIEVSGAVEEDDAGEKVYRIRVSDNGIGFNVKYLDRIFTVFQRLNSREEYEGTGMGLAISKKIMDKHRGAISAVSTEGKGSTFILSFPYNLICTSGKPGINH